jgi:D-alanyl-D-alanine carboxypeptidase
MTRRRHLCLRACGAFLAVAFLAARADEPPKPEGIDDPAVWNRIEEFVRSRLEAERIPGLALAVVDGSGRTREGYWGVSDLKTGAPVGAATLFQIGSLSKAFTATLLLKLVEAGRLDLDAPVTKYLPWFEAPGGSRPPSLHQLLTHTSGLPADRDDILSPVAQAFAVRDRRALVRPGAGFHYSNVGYQILGLVAEQAAHRTTAEMLASEIFAPLQMTSTTGAITAAQKLNAATGYVPLRDDRPPHPNDPLVEAPWIEYSGADGCILSTAPDMARWMKAIVGRGTGPSGRIFSAESFDRLVRPWVRVSPFDVTAYGYGFFVRSVEGRTVVRHTGGMLGFTSALAADLDGVRGVVVLTNVARADARPTDVADFVLRTLVAAQKGGALPDLPKEDRARDPNARDYAGTFVAPGGDRLVFEAAEERLFLVRSGGRFPMEARGEDRFWVGHPDFGLYFLRFGRQNGRVVEALYGPSWYAADGYDGQRAFSLPREWAAFRGHYRSAHPWVNNFRVFFRKGKLWMETPDGAERILMPLEPGLFRIGEERTPETVRFDEVVGGWAQRANLSGAEFYRFFTP